MFIIYSIHPTVYTLIIQGLYLKYLVYLFNFIFIMLLSHVDIVIVTIFKKYHLHNTIIGIKPFFYLLFVQILLFKTRKGFEFVSGISNVMLLRLNTIAYVSLYKIYFSKKLIYIYVYKYIIYHIL
jgi:hypothetical protein